MYTASSSGKVSISNRVYSCASWRNLHLKPGESCWSSLYQEILGWGLPDTIAQKRAGLPDSTVVGSSSRIIWGGSGAGNWGKVRWQRETGERRKEREISLSILSVIENYLQRIKQNKPLLFLILCVRENLPSSLIQGEWFSSKWLNIISCVSISVSGKMCPIIVRLITLKRHICPFEQSSFI